MWVLGYVRLSRLTDESTSVARQEELIRRWAESHAATVAAVVHDTDVSGSVAPEQRAGLGPWLSDQPPAPWDVLVAWRLDRVSRSSLDTHRVLDLLDGSGRRLVTIDDGLDTGSTWGSVLVKLAGVFAEVERAAIAERSAAGREALRRSGRYGGEAVQYGYRAVQNPDGPGWVLVLDDPAVAVVRDAVERVLRGDSVESIARDLTARGVATPRDRQRELKGHPVEGAAWAATSLQRLLRSSSLTGRAYRSDGAPVVVDGEQVTKAPPILTLAEHRRVLAALDARSRSKTRTDAPHPTSGLVLCLVCGRTLHHRSQKTGGRTYSYAYCPDRHGRSIRVERLWALLGESFLDEMGHRDAVERVHVPASDVGAALDDARAAVEDLAERLGSARSSAVRDALAAQLDALDSRVEELEATPSTPARTELRPLGMSWSRLWAGCTDDQRRDVLVRSGIRLAVVDHPLSGWRAHLWVPGDVLDGLDAP